MFLQPQVHSVLATLLGAGRRFGESTRVHSKEWSLQFQHYRTRATEIIRSLHGTGRKTQMLTILAIFGRFLWDTYAIRPAKWIRRGFGKRNAWFMIAGQLPLLTALTLILLPAMVFDSPHNQGYYYFARTLAYDPISLLPVLLGLVTMAAILHFPLPMRSAGDSDETV